MGSYIILGQTETPRVFDEGIVDYEVVSSNMYPVRKLEKGEAFFLTG